MVGADGDDTYVVDDAGDVVNEAGTGTDLVESAITFTLGANLENLTLIGGGPGGHRCDRVRRLEEVTGSEVEGHLLAHPLGHVVEIGAVALGQDDLGQAHPVGGEHLLLDAADR